MFQEYPKMLYRAADDYRIVQDADQEHAANQDGYMAHDAKPAAKPRRAKAD